MSMIKIPLIIIMLLLVLSSYSQNGSPDDYQDIKRKYKVKDITYNKDINAFLISKRGDYGLVSSKETGFEMLIPMEYDSILPQNTSFRHILIWDESKIGVYSSEYKYLLEPQFHNVRTNEYNEGFLEISLHNMRGIYDLRYQKFIVNPEYDNIDFLNYKYSAGLLLLRKNDKYGLLNIYKNKIIFDIKYDEINYHKEFVKDVDGAFYESYIELITNGKRKFYNGANIYDEVKLYGYSKNNESRLRYLSADTLVESALTVKGEFLARIELSQKWGLYENYDDLFRAIIPPKYDKIEFYEWGSPLTVIHRNGFMGYFVKEWEDSLDQYPQTCIYNELKLVDDSKYRKHLAALINKKWYWVDWYEGTYNKNEYYNSFEEMKPTEDNLSKYYQKDTIPL